MHELRFQTVLKTIIFFVNFKAKCRWFLIFLIFLSSPDPRNNIRTIILRDDTDYKEIIEIRRVFVHPAFFFPSLYYDIAVAELGIYFSFFILRPRNPKKGCLQWRSQKFTLGCKFSCLSKKVNHIQCLTVWVGGAQWLLLPRKMKKYTRHI